MLPGANLTALAEIPVSQDTPFPDVRWLWLPRSPLHPCSTAPGATMSTPGSPGGAEQSRSAGSPHAPKEHPRLLSHTRVKLSFRDAEVRSFRIGAPRIAPASCNVHGHFGCPTRPISFPSRKAKGCQIPPNPNPVPDLLLTASLASSGDPAPQLRSHETPHAALGAVLAPSA